MTVPHRTEVAGVELDPDQITTRWQQPARTVSSGYSSIIASTATSDGQLFVSGDDHLYALEEFDGSTNWSYDFHSLPFPSVNPAGIADGIVYVAAGQQSSTYLFASVPAAFTRTPAPTADCTALQPRVRNCSSPPRNRLRCGRRRSTPTASIPIRDICR